MDPRIVLLIREADGRETTHVRQQVILQHILIAFAVHLVGDEDKGRLAEGRKSCPDHYAAPAKTPLGEATRLLPQITPVICKTVGPIKIELQIVTPNDLDENSVIKGKNYSRENQIQTYLIPIVGPCHVLLCKIHSVYFVFWFQIRVCFQLLPGEVGSRFDRPPDGIL